MVEPVYIPTRNTLLLYGLTYQLEATSENGNRYKAAINAPNDLAATRMLCKWLDSGLYQVAHKEAGASSKHWKFKGFGSFRDEAHFLRLLDVKLVDALGDFLNNT